MPASTRLATVFATVLAALTASAAFALDPTVQLTYLGETRFPSGYTTPQTGAKPIGGLSGITYAGNDTYYAISDARGEDPDKTPARFYTLTLRLYAQKPVVQVEFKNMTALTHYDGSPFPAGMLDPEDIVLDSARDAVWISSEGDRDMEGAQPFVHRFSLGGPRAGRQEESLLLPQPFLIDRKGGSKGVRDNLAFESLTITPDQKTLVTATENSLQQESAETTPEHGSRSRILTFDLATRRSGKQFAYDVEPVAEAPQPAAAFAVNGLCALLALSDTRFLALERSYSTGARGTGGTGNIIRIYEIDTTGATDISGMDDLDTAPTPIVPVRKTLVCDLNALPAAGPDFKTDNIEGMTFGPDLPDGARSLLLVSDNNFDKTKQQFTQFVAFKVTPR